MRVEQKERLARTRDWSDSAIAWRLKAALTLSGKRQNELANELGRPTQTVNTQFTKGRPSNALMTYFYRNHRVDYNFILYGDLLQLPVDVQDKLLAILAAQEPS
tara:strand:+ start:19 stop:330 length:312 start_codon:yes stop_codon:yes gene_type:complete